MCDKMEKICVEEAARLAGEQYVFEASFKEGAEKGWAEGWTAGWTAGLNCSATDGKAARAQAGSHSTKRTNEDGVETEDVEFQMSSEWAQLFARGEKQRAKSQQQMEQREKREQQHEASGEGLSKLDLGGLHRQQREEQVRKLYGECGTLSSDLLQVEAELDARFQNSVSSLGANPWPFV